MGSIAYVLQQTKPLEGKDAVRVFKETIVHGPKKVSDEFRRECLALANAFEHSRERNPDGAVLLEILTLGDREIAEGKVSPASDVVRRLREKAPSGQCPSKSC